MSRAWRSFSSGVVVAMAVATGLGASAVQADDGRGKQIYDQFCSICHGRYGRGDGPLAANLQVRPVSFVDSSWLAGRSDEQIIQGLLGGHSRMSIPNVLQPDALADTVAYIRTLSVPGQNVSIADGRDIYNAVCYACHGVNGDGNGPAKAAPGTPPPRDFTSKEFVIEGREAEIARTITLGAEASFHGSSFMPAWGSSLSEQQIQDLIAYIKTFKQKKKN